MREDTPLGVGLNHSLKFSPMPPPYFSTVKTSPGTFLPTLMGRSTRKSLRFERKPRERGFWTPPRRGAFVPPGKITLGGGVLGSLHFGAMVLNDFPTSRYRNCLSL